MRICTCHLFNTQKKGIPPCRKTPHVSKEDDELSAMQPTALVVHHHLIPSPYIPAIHLPFPVDHPAFSKDVPTPIQWCLLPACPKVFRRSTISHSNSNPEAHILVQPMVPTQASTLSNNHLPTCRVMEKPSKPFL